MPRVTQIIKRVFADLPRTPYQPGACDEFLKIDSQMGLDVPATQAALMDRYDALSKEADFVEVVEALAALEEIIVQMRAKKMIESELRLSLSRHYIYARTIFYRRGSEINDIRTVVGVTEDWGDNIEELIINLEFRAIAKAKLLEVIDREIEKNIFNLKLVYSND